MNLKDYIKGDRRGKEANRLEREAMNDLFLQEALEGFDKVKGNHPKIIEQLEKRIHYASNKRKKQRVWIYFGSIAASVLFIIGFSYYFIFVDSPNEPMLIAENKTVALEQEEIYFEEAEAFDLQPEERKPVLRTSIAESLETLACADAESNTHSEQSDVIETLAIVTEKEIDFVSEEKQISQKIMEVESDALADNARTDHKRKEVPAQETFAQTKSMAPKSATQNEIAKSDQMAPKPATFGEKEFKEYFLKNADKNVCAGKVAKVKVTFFINENGKPTEIKYDSFSCEEAKKTMEKLLNASPAWTEKNRKIGMTIVW